MMRVLIVDDNVDLAENIAEILQFDGHLTEVASSAEDALPMATRTPPDAIITDYRLPGMTGAQFLRSLPDRIRLARAILISAYTDEGTMNEAKDAGATFIAKPVDFQILCRVVREASA